MSYLEEPTDMEFRLRHAPSEWIRFHILTWGPRGMSGERHGQPWPCTVLHADILESRVYGDAKEVQS